MKRAIEQMGVTRAARTLLKLNQTDGFDCQGCAWPDPAPGERHTAEFCENGAKAVTEEATRRTRRPEFFAAHPLERAPRADRLLAGPAGPDHRADGAARRRRSHYEPISWDDAFALIARHLNGLDSPDEAIFYTSGKTSNEAAFAYQLFVRAFGTNNLPDCSNMCHESTVGRARRGRSASARARSRSRHPRRQADRDRRARTPAPTTRGCSRRSRRRSGTARGSSPSTRSGRRGWSGSRTRRRRAAWSARHRPRRPAPAGPDQRRPRAVPGDRVAAARVGRRRPRVHRAAHHRLRGVGRPRARARLGRRTPRRPASAASRSSRPRGCSRSPTRRSSAGRWASPSTATPSPPSRSSRTSRSSRATSASPAPGSARCAGTRTSRATARWVSGSGRRTHFLDALRDEFGFEPPREHGFDSVAAIKALRDGDAKVFFGDGRQLRLRGPGHRGHRGGLRAGPTSPCTCPPS